MKKKIMQRLVLRLDNLKIKHKLYLLYFVCVLLPLVLTDALIGYNMISHERKIRSLEKEQLAETVINSFTAELNAASSFEISIYKNSYINNYVKQTYESPIDYLMSFQELNSRTLFTGNTGLNNYNFVIYTDNPTVINGGIIQKKSKAKQNLWYLDFVNTYNYPSLHFDYDTSLVVSNTRKIFLVRKMDYYKKNDSHSIIKVEVNYSDLYQKFLDMNSSYPFYITYDGKEIISNTAASYIGQNYNNFNENTKDAICHSFNIFGKNLKLYVLDQPVGIFDFLKSYSHILTIVFILNILLPTIFLTMLNKSFTNRIFELTDAIQNSSLSNLKKIEAQKGKDEIGILITRYNEMAERIENLIQTVYENNLKEKNMIVARQKAELLALHSQINPHFLFNILESIRMHSVIKKEAETAEMIQRLAVIQRQYVDWENDNVTIKDELDCVKTYLDLQKYRFGERLNYNIELDDDCTKLFIPKLSIVTFVENACVHGIEEKSSCCWIFIRVYKKDKYIEIEIEDTGCGMNQEKLSQIKERMSNASIELLMKKHHVGIINACLRLKIFTNNTVRFNVESEEYEGTTFTIQIPIEATINQFTKKEGGEQHA